jgi:hypothetical protein
MMKAVISQTVDVGKLVSGHSLVPIMEPLDVASFVSKLKVCRAFETAVPVTYEVHPDLPATVMCDSEWLWQVVLSSHRMNCIDNIVYCCWSLKHINVEQRLQFAEFIMH